MKKQYDLEPCKSCGDVTCSGQCNWLVSFAWFIVICGGVLVGWFVKSMIYYWIGK
jgi:hypothetical protein